MELGKKIKKLRTDKMMNQDDLARALNVSQKTVSSWEVGRTEPNMGMLSSLANVLECDINYLITPDTPTQKLVIRNPYQKEIDEAFSNLDKTFKEMENAFDFISSLDDGTTILIEMRRTMKEADKEKMMNVLSAMFPEAFSKAVKKVEEEKDED